MTICGEFGYALAALATALLLLAFPQAKAEGVKFDLGVGQCRYQRSPDGMWWQSDQENSSRYKDNGCGMLGVTGKLTENWGWAVRYVNLGMAHTRALAVTCPGDDCSKRDQNIDPRRAECAPAFNGNNCQYQWLGDGGMKGVTFALTRTLATWRKFSLEGEGGAYIFRMKWSEQVEQLGCSDPNCAWRITVDQRTGYYVSPTFGLVGRVDITKRASLFLRKDFYLRTQQHMPISSGIGGYAQTWIAGVTTSF